MPWGTTQFKSNLFWRFGKAKMEFLNLWNLCHLLFHALLQSSLVEHNNFVMLFLGAASFWSVVHGGNFSATRLAFTIAWHLPFHFALLKKL